MKSSVASITVTYNPDLSLLNRQIQSLIGQVDEIIIVDNASKNISSFKDLIKKLINSDLNICLIECEDNMGLGYAQNLGIRSAIKSNYSHILILDQDSVLNEDFILKMKRAEDSLIQNSVKVGAIGPVYFNEISGEIYPITKYFGPFIQRIKPVNSPVEASFLIASGSYISLSVINEVGYMNEDLFIDYVDVEWCFRAKSLGYKLFANPVVKMSHTIGEKRASVLGRTISVHSPLRRYYLYRNSIYMIKNKSIHSGYKIRECTFNLLRLAVFMFLSKEKSRYLKYSIYGFIDGFKGKVGKCPYNF